MEESITFSKADATSVQHSHTNGGVVTLNIVDYNVHQVLVAALMRISIVMVIDR